jgi:hypothetical protein
MIDLDSHHLVQMILGQLSFLLVAFMNYLRDLNMQTPIHGRQLFISSLWSGFMVWFLDHHRFIFSSFSEDIRMELISHHVLQKVVEKLQDMNASVALAALKCIPVLCSHGKDF